MNPRQDLAEQIPGDLYRAYRSSLEDAPYGATDQAVLHTAAYDVTRHRSQVGVYTALGVLVAALGLVLSVTLLPSRVERVTGADMAAIPQPSGGKEAPKVPGTNADRNEQMPYGGYSANVVLGPAYTQESQLEQARVAMQFTADSQYATLAMQAEATQSDLHDVTLELLRIQPNLSSAR